MGDKETNDCSTTPPGDTKITKEYFLAVCVLSLSVLILIVLQGESSGQPLNSS